jgi:hypothetical protein
MDGEMKSKVDLKYFLTGIGTGLGHMIHLSDHVFWSDRILRIEETARVVS